MKIKYILLAIAGMSACLSACKKDSQKSLNNGAAFIGKWTEVKLHVSQTNNGVVTDTTVNAASFTAYDYAQFNTDYTLNIFQSGGNPAPGNAAPDFIAKSTYNYTIAGSVATLTSAGLEVPPAIMPGDTLITARTVTMIDASNIDLRMTVYNGPAKATPNPSYISDAYYTKVQ